MHIDAELARPYHRNEDSGGELKILKCQTGATNALIASMRLGDRASLKLYYVAANFRSPRPVFPIFFKAIL